MNEILKTQRLSHNEWEAWQDVVAEWRALVPGLDLNDTRCSPLVRAVELWAEKLVALRLAQDPVTRHNACAEKHHAYDAVRTARQEEVNEIDEEIEEIEEGAPAD